MKTILRHFAAGLLGMAIAVTWAGCSVKPQPQTTEIRPEMLDDIKRAELLERAKFELDTAKVNLARRRCCAAARNIEVSRRILKDNIPAAEALPKTKAVLDELHRVEIQNLEAWAVELEKEAKEVGVAEQYRDAREKLRALLATKDANLSVEKRDEIELKIKQLDLAYERQKVKDAIRLEDRSPYDVNREVDQLYREAQHLYDKGRYAEARDKVEQILVKNPYDEKAIRLMVNISKAQQRIGKTVKDKVFIDMMTVQGWRWGTPSTPTLDNRDDASAIHSDMKTVQGWRWALPATPTLDNSDDASAIRSKIETIVIPEMKFNRDTTLAEIIIKLKKASKDFDSDGGQGINFFIANDPAHQDTGKAKLGKASELLEDEPINTELNITNLPLQDALQKVLDAYKGQIDYEIDRYTVTFYRPKDKATLRQRLQAELNSADEVWIIEKPAARPSKPAAADRPDLLATGKDGELIPIPLQHSSYEVRVAGILAETHVRQTYANPFTAKIEATYVFPLPDDAAVTDFLMIIGERKIRGLIREREEAKRIYEEAKSQGYVAALLTEERPNIFTQKVANIEPGKQIDIEITYFNTAKYLDGEFELALPTVVGPRYNPAGTTAGVDAVPRGKGCKSPQAVAIEYLAPGERSGHLIDITVELDPQVTLERIASPSHEIATKSLGDGRSRITLKAQEMVPNRDFILHWRPAGKPLQTAFWIGGTEKERTFALLLMPPASETVLPRQPREMIFIVDRSGSMSGQPMAKVQEAMRNCLNGLDGKDTFQIVEFSNQASSFGPNPVPATEANVKRAIDYVNKLDGSGGTEVEAGLRLAFGIPHDPKKLRIMSIMTDGYIGNEAQILMQVQEQLGATRIFAFGVGNSVNRYLIESLAKIGHGAAAFVGLNDDSGTAVGQFYRRAAYPALTNVAIDWGGLKVEDVYPRRLPDLFVGRPVLVTGRLVSAISKDTRIAIDGNRGGEPVRAYLPVSAATIPVPAVCHVWAKHKISQLLLDNASNRRQDFQKDLTEFSISHTVLCPYTAFLAVDASRITEGNAGYSVNVPVPVPDGVRYETTVANQEKRK